MQILERKITAWGPSDFFKEKLERAGPILIFIATMLWATDAPFRYHLTQNLSANFIVLAEHAVNVVLILPFIFLGWKEIKNLNLKQWLAVLVIGIGASALASILFTKAFSFVNPSIAIVLQKLQPLIVIGLATSFLQEKLGKRFWLWATLALLGTYVISFPDLVPRLYYGEVWNPNIVGVLFSLGAAALWGLGTVLGRYLLQPHPPVNPHTFDRRALDPAAGKTRTLRTSAGHSTQGVGVNNDDRRYLLDAEIPAVMRFQTITALRFLVAFLFLIALNFKTNTLATLSALTGKDVLFLIIVAVTSGFTSLFIYYKGLRHTKASIATLAELGFPFLAVIVNAAMLGLFLQPTQVAGMVLLLFAVFGLTKVNRTNAASS